MPLTSNIACDHCQLRHLSYTSKLSIDRYTARLHVKDADNPVTLFRAPCTDTRGRRKTNLLVPCIAALTLALAGVPEGALCKTASHLPILPRDHPSLEFAAEYPSYLCNSDGPMPKQQDPSETISEFKSCVNMDVKELEKWLKTKDSNEVSLSKAIPLQA